MKRKNKYYYMYVIQIHRGHRWEDFAFYDKSEYTVKQVFKDLREYRAKRYAPYKIIERRILNEENKY